MNDDWYYNPKNWAGWPPKMLSIALPMPCEVKPDAPTVTMKRSISFTHLQDGPPLGSEAQDAIDTAILKAVRRQEAQLLGLFMGETIPPGTEAEHITTEAALAKTWLTLIEKMPKRIVKVREAYLGNKTYAVVFWSDDTINHVTATADTLLRELGWVDYALACELREEWYTYQHDLTQKVREMQKENAGERDTTD